MNTALHSSMIVDFKAFSTPPLQAIRHLRVVTEIIDSCFKSTDKNTQCSKLSYLASCPGTNSGLHLLVRDAGAHF